jgi:hypothetical protein
MLANDAEGILSIEFPSKQASSISKIGKNLPHVSVNSSIKEIEPRELDETLLREKRGFCPREGLPNGRKIFFTSLIER